MSVFIILSWGFKLNLVRYKQRVTNWKCLNDKFQPAATHMFSSRIILSLLWATTANCFWGWWSTWRVLSRKFYSCGLSDIFDYHNHNHTFFFFITFCGKWSVASNMQPQHNIYNFIKKFNEMADIFKCKYKVKCFVISIYIHTHSLTFRYYCFVFAVAAGLFCWPISHDFHISLIFFEKHFIPNPD